MFSVDIRKVLEQLFWRTYFERTFLHTLASEVNSGNDCLELFLESRFQNHPDLVIWQKYQSLSKQRLKHNLAHISSLNLTLRFLLNLGFVCLSSAVRTEKPNACSPWTSCYNCSYFRCYYHIINSNGRLGPLTVDVMTGKVQT